MSDYEPRLRASTVLKWEIGCSVTVTKDGEDSRPKLDAYEARLSEAQLRELAALFLELANGGPK